MDCKWSNWTKSECLGICGYGTQIWTREKLFHHQHVPTHYHPIYPSHLPVHYPVHFPVHLPVHDKDHNDHKDHNDPHQDQHHGYEKRSASDLPTIGYHHVRKECIGESTKTVICQLDPCPGMQ